MTPLPMKGAAVMTRMGMHRRPLRWNELTAMLALCFFRVIGGYTAIDDKTPRRVIHFICSKQM